MIDQNQSRRHPVLSIIIPTCNRAAMLQDTLHSLLEGCKGQEQLIECLVVDNGSTDATRSVAEDFAKNAPFPVTHIFAACPGLHVGRNLGAVRAQGEILAYLDDDVFVQPGWAAALLARFNDPVNMIVGGPCLPHWEISPPAWVEAFRSPLPGGGWAMGTLSLIDMGDVPMPVSGGYIFGCNFAVRRHFVLEAGGFHPDGMPPALLKFRGDGETEMGQKVDMHPEYTAFYDPAAAVLHRVPAARLTRGYVASVAKRFGIGYGYTLFRGHGRKRGGAFLRQWLLQVYALAIAVMKFLTIKMRSIANSPEEGLSISQQEWGAIASWHILAHYTRIQFSPVLQDWVTQSSYLPDAPCPYHPMSQENQ